MGVADYSAVLEIYGIVYQPSDIQELGNAGGFSGAKLWKLRSSSELLCLRCWPRPHPSPDSLAFIHRMLLNAKNAGISFVPYPISTPDGRTFVRHEGHLWELSPWMPGQADYHQRPSVRKLQAALAALAKFHLGTNNLDLDVQNCSISTGLGDRWRQVNSLLDGELERLTVAVKRRPADPWSASSDRVLALARPVLPGLRDSLKVVVGVSLPLQPCIRDIWHDHVLFRGNQVSGMIDFGAVRIDTVAGDIARLLGSLVEDDPIGWQHGIAAYRQVRPLADNELEAIACFDFSNSVLSGVNWVRWLYVDNRQFEAKAVLARLDGILRRLEHRNGDLGLLQSRYKQKSSGSVIK